MAEEVAFVLKGEIDHHRSKELRKELDMLIETMRPRRLVLDFRNVTLMDSSGVGLVLGRYKKLKELGGTVCVKRVNRQIDAVLKVSGVYQVISKV